MLCVNTYSQDHVDAARASVAAHVAAYRELVAAARDGGDAGRADAATDAFEPLFFNGLVQALDTYFTHRSRGLEGKDGNPCNEVRVLCASLTAGGGVLLRDKTIRLDPSQSVLGLAPGETIAVREGDFVRLAEAFFAEVERRFGTAAAVA